MAFVNPPLPPPLPNKHKFSKHGAPSHLEKCLFPLFLRQLHPDYRDKCLDVHNAKQGNYHNHKEDRKILQH